MKKFTDVFPDVHVFRDFLSRANKIKGVDYYTWEIHFHSVIESAPLNDAERGDFWLALYASVNYLCVNFYDKDRRYVTFRSDACDFPAWLSRERFEMMCWNVFTCVIKEMWRKGRD